MTNYRVFQYLIFHNKEEGKPTIIKDLTTVLEKSEDLVKMRAIRELDNEWDDKLDEVVVVVRGF